MSPVCNPAKPTSMVSAVRSTAPDAASKLNGTRLWKTSRPATEFARALTTAPAAIQAWVSLSTTMIVADAPIPTRAPIAARPLSRRRELSSLASTSTLPPAFTTATLSTKA